MAKVDDLKAMIADAESIVAFTGAGISTELGIPDYRSPGGIWTKFRPIDFGDSPPPRPAGRPGGASSPATRCCRRRHPTPDTGHWPGWWSWARWPPSSRRISTGCISRPACPTTRSSSCTATPRTRPPSIAAGATSSIGCAISSPSTSGCRCARPTRSMIKTATISFGQSMPEAEMRRAQAATLGADLFIVLGSSLVVYPAAGFPTLAQAQRITPRDRQSRAYRPGRDRRPRDQRRDRRNDEPGRGRELTAPLGPRAGQEGFRHDAASPAASCGALPRPQYHVCERQRGAEHRHPSANPRTTTRPQPARLMEIVTIDGKLFCRRAHPARDGCRWSSWCRAAWASRPRTVARGKFTDIGIVLPSVLDPFGARHRLDGREPERQHSSAASAWGCACCCKCSVLRRHRRRADRAR